MEAPKGGARMVGPAGWESPKFRAFFPFSRHNLALFVSLGVRGILVVFKAPGP